jgi:hypothetical protein
MQKFENLGKRLTKKEQRKIMGGNPPLACEDECVLEVGVPTGCGQGETCVNITCPYNEEACYNVCMNIG